MWAERSDYCEGQAYPPFDPLYGGGSSGGDLYLNANEADPAVFPGPPYTDPTGGWTFIHNIDDKVMGFVAFAASAICYDSPLYLNLNLNGYRGVAVIREMSADLGAWNSIQEICGDSGAATKAATDDWRCEDPPNNWVPTCAARAEGIVAVQSMKVDGWRPSFQRNIVFDTPQELTNAFSQNRPYQYWDGILDPDDESYERWVAEGLVEPIEMPAFGPSLHERALLDKAAGSCDCPQPQ